MKKYSKQQKENNPTQECLQEEYQKNIQDQIKLFLKQTNLLSSQKKVLKQLNCQSSQIQLVNKFKQLRKKLKLSQIQNNKNISKISSLQQQLQICKNIIKKIKNTQLLYEEEKEKNIRLSIKLKSHQHQKQSLQKGEQENKNLKLKLVNYIKQIKQLQKENNQIDKIKSKYQLQIQKIKTHYEYQLKSNQKIISQLEEENTNLKQLTNKKETIIKKNQIQLQTLRFQRQFQQIKQVYTLNTNQDKTSYKRYKNYQNHIQQLQKDNNQMKVKLQSLQEKLQELQQLKIQNQSQLEFFQFKQQTYESHIDKMQDRIKKLQSKLLQEKNYSLKQLKRYEKVEQESERKLEYCLVLLKQVIQKFKLYGYDDSQSQDEYRKKYQDFNQERNTMKNNKLNLEQSEKNSQYKSQKTSQHKSQYKSQLQRTLDGQSNKLISKNNPLKEYANILNQKIKRILNGKQIPFLDTNSKQFVNLNDFKKMTINKLKFNQSNNCRQTNQTVQIDKQKIYKKNERSRIQSSSDNSKSKKQYRNNQNNNKECASKNKLNFDINQNCKDNNKEKKGVYKKSKQQYCLLTDKHNKNTNINNKNYQTTIKKPSYRDLYQLFQSNNSEEYKQNTTISEDCQVIQKNIFTGRQTKQSLQHSNVSFSNKKNFYEQNSSSNCFLSSRRSAKKYDYLKDIEELNVNDDISNSNWNTRNVYLQSQQQKENQGFLSDRFY